MRVSSGTEISSIECSCIREYQIELKKDEFKLYLVENVGRLTNKVSVRNMSMGNSIPRIKTVSFLHFYARNMFIQL